MSTVKNPLTTLLRIDYPIIQAGMVWVSGAKLAAASSEAGILGVLGAGSMKPALLEEHILKAKALSPRGNLAVNVPLLYEGATEQIALALDLGIRIFITSAGAPKFTKMIRDRGGIVGHVVSTPALAKKCEDAGVHFVVAEGFEAGGHNGRDELTTMVLVPEVVDAVKIPVVAAGGIGDVRQIRAALALGAAGVQMGTRFLMTRESSAHQAFQDLVLRSKPEDTVLCMKELIPVRLLKNAFCQKVLAMERDSQHSAEDLRELLGKGRAREGMLLGDLEEGELEVGQVSGMITDLPTVAELVARFQVAFSDS